MVNQQPVVEIEKQMININEASEIAYWTEKFDTTKVKLKAAINAAGPVIKDVESYLKKK
jgi:hypothetical protein